MKKALITGATGQDGSYLCELLLNKGYEVHGLKRRSSVFNTQRVDYLFADDHTPGNRFFLHYGDLADGTSLRRIIEKIQPDEVYNLAAQSHVRISFEQPEYTADIVATGVLRLLEAIRDYINISGKQVRVYQASSSEMFGSALPPQSETTPFHPRSPYAVSKVAAFWYGVNYRESYNMFVCNGILFNHESPKRGETFVTRKVTRAVARIKMGLQDKLYMGNLDSYRDWGYAGDFVEAMWLMLQQNTPDDYVVATGESHSVKELVELAFSYVGLNWLDYIVIDPRYYRPAEVNHLLGDYTKAMTTLGWRPSVTFSELIKMMVDNDLEIARRDKLVFNNMSIAGVNDNATAG